MILILRQRHRAEAHAYSSVYNTLRLVRSPPTTADVHAKDIQLILTTDGKIITKSVDSVANSMHDSFYFANENAGKLPASPPPKSIPLYGGRSPPPDYASGSESNSEYADPDLTKSSPEVPLIPPPPSGRRRSHVNRNCENFVDKQPEEIHYAASDVSTIMSNS